MRSPDCNSQKSGAPALLTTVQGAGANAPDVGTGRAPLIALEQEVRRQLCKLEMHVVQVPEVCGSRVGLEAIC